MTPAQAFDTLYRAGYFTVKPKGDVVHYCRWCLHELGRNHARGCVVHALWEGTRDG